MLRIQPTDFFSFYSQSCVSKEQIVPLAVTIREENRNEMFIRHHIEIPARSSCCKIHTAPERILPEAFLALLPYKVEDQFYIHKPI